MSENEKHYRLVKKCRTCGGKNLVSYLNLGKMPLANNLILASQITTEVKFPLDVLVCKDCFFSELSVVVDPEYMFLNYAYRSAISDSFKLHCQEMAEDLASSTLKKNDLVVDIASNDGSLLQPFKKLGMRVLGIEPAKNIAKIAEDEGIETIVKFWNVEIAKGVREKYGKAKIITAFNVFAHVDDMHGFIEAAGELLDETGYLIIESPHILNLIEKTEFDTIYHEHLSYLSLRPLRDLVAKHNLKISKVETYDIHGGSIRMFIEHADQNREDGSVEKLISREKSAGLYSLDRYFKFKEQVEKIRTDLVAKVKDLKKRNKKVSAFAASAKGNTLLNYCQIDSRQIDYIFDDTPEKQNKLAPGVHIPVISPKFIQEKKPDYLLILAWNFADEIMAKTKSFKARDGKYILPIPKLEVK